MKSSHAHRKLPASSLLKLLVAQTRHTRSTLVVATPESSIEGLLNLEVKLQQDCDPAAPYFAVPSRLAPLAA
jgi:hypothetical protein